MRRYRVAGGPVRLGIGTLLMLTAAQFEPRKAVLDLVKKREKKSKDGKADESEFVVKPLADVHFKVGEIIGLPDLPKGMIEQLEPLDPPETETEKRAALLAAGRASGAADDGKPRAAHSPFMPEKIQLVAGRAAKGDKQPAIAAVVVDQGDAIARVLKDENVSVEEWNAATDDARTKAIADKCETLRAEALKAQESA
jgi:hypothetical protein